MLSIYISALSIALMVDLFKKCAKGALGSALGTINFRKNPVDCCTDNRHCIVSLYCFTDNHKSQII